MGCGLVAAAPSKFMVSKYIVAIKWLFHLCEMCCGLGGRMFVCVIPQESKLRCSKDKNIYRRDRNIGRVL